MDNSWKFQCRVVDNKTYMYRAMQSLYAMIKAKAADGGCPRDNVEEK